MCVLDRMTSFEMGRLAVAGKVDGDPEESLRKERNEAVKSPSVVLKTVEAEDREACFFAPFDTWN